MVRQTETMDDIFASGSTPRLPEADSPVLLIDSDTIAFRVAAAADGRQYKLGKTAFKFKEDVIKYCIKHGKDIQAIEEDNYPDPIRNVLSSLDDIVNKVKSFGNYLWVGPFHMEFYHTGKRNFRHDILEDYKISRKDKKKPFHLDAAKDHYRSLYKEWTEEGFEADDLIGIRAHELARKGIEYCIVSVDKDLKTIPCVYYNFVTGDISRHSVLDAMKFMYCQTIAGDNTDDIPGVYGLSISPKLNGTGKAEKIINKAFEEVADLTLPEIENHLYETALNAWLEGGPGTRGSYGCQSLEEVSAAFDKTAMCVFILHDRDVMWKKPVGGYCNYEENKVWRDFTDKRKEV